MTDEKDPKNGEPRHIDRTAVILALIAAVVSIAGGYLTYRAAVEPIITEMKIHATETARASEQQETAIPSQQTSAPVSAGQSSIPVPLPSMEPAATVAASSSVIITEPFLMELVRVPAGPFFMGSDPERDPSAPEKGAMERLHRVPNVPEFLIGKYEVTNSQYAVFVKATGHEASNRGDSTSMFAGKENQPVTDVDWADAVQFTEWLRGQTDMEFRLCTEAEWEKACRGDLDTRILPWGDMVTSGTQLNFYDLSRDDSTSEINDGYPFAAPVGSYPDGVSLYGAMDMVGNVWEWTASLYKPYPYFVGGDAEDPNNTSDSRVLRGGAWDSKANEATCSNRYAPVPTHKTKANGFRVCATQIR